MKRPSLPRDLDKQLGTRPMSPPAVRITEATKVTIAKPIPSRWSPTGPVVGGFASLGIGRYIEEQQ